MAQVNLGGANGHQVELTISLANARRAVEEAYVELIGDNGHLAELLAEFRSALLRNNFSAQEAFLLTRDYLRYYLNLTLEDEVGTDGN